MGKVINKDIQGMGKKVKFSLVLFFMLLTTVFIHQGLLMPTRAEASVASLNAWPATPQIVSNAATGTVTGTVTVSAGTNRIMLVVVGAEYTAPPATQPITVTYGGKRVTQLQNNFSGPNTIWLGFINDADLASASGTTLSVTNGNTTNLTAMYASAAVYSGVDQTTPISGSNSVSSGATAVTTMNMPAFNVKGAAGNTALSFYMSNRNLQSQTIDAAYTQNVQYLGTNFYMAFNTITAPPAALITSAPAVTTATASLGSAVGVGLVPTGVTVGAIGSCSQCHGYPPVDGTARNVPAGQFQGSHNKHSGSAASQYGYVCTRCHVNNTTFNHANGNIEMANPINGNTGASYGKGTSFAVSNAAFSGNTCANTFCHSNGTGSTTQTGDTRGIVANTSVAWGGSTTCTSCHSQPPAYANYTGTTSVTGSKSNSHGGTTHAAQTCNVCHSSVTTSDGGVTYATYTTHANGRYNLKATLGYTYAVRGGTCSTPGCHGAATWGRKLGCVNCHNTTITRTLGRPGTQLANVVAEFGLAWGHRKSGLAAVTDADCIVCHLEGDSATGKPDPLYHQNGNIDLRDPTAATAKTAITDMTGAAWTFQRFSTSYAAGTRTTTGNTSNTIDNIITQKFCLGCHRAAGATNPGARSGTSPTQYLPFGTGASTYNNAAYPVGISAGVVGGVVDVDSQFATTNSSFHPVKGPQNNSYAQGAKMIAPYGVTKTNGTPSNGIVLNCFDCHNVVGTPLTRRTVAAHGNAVTLRGSIRAAGTTAATNLCLNCHITAYATTSTQHGSGSAFASGADSAMGTSYFNSCYYCHGTATAGATVTGTTQVRPIRAVEVHGFNDRTQGTVGSKWTNGTFSHRPYAFIRNSLSYWSPKSVPAGETLQRSGGCTGTGGTCNNNMGSSTSYTPGGVY